MLNFFAELKRRHVYRVAAAYVVVAWLILQVVNNVAPGLNLPNAAVTLVIMLLAAAFPIALIFAWIFDLHVTGPQDNPAPAAKTTRLDVALIGALFAVIGIFLYQQFIPSKEAGRQTVSTSLVTPPQTAISIAVLPFANLSSDAEQEFFSDGMTEEITAALAQIKGLRVVGRTSAFQFKGQNKDLRAIGQTLGASHLIEGSVRKAGNRVRITAQLVQAGEDTHLWAESYDRELTDVFAIQEDIAQAIARALSVPLGLGQGQTLVSNRNIDPELHQQYLQAKALVRARGLTRMTDAAALLEPVVARDPGFAPAWALLAQAYHFTPTYHPARDSSAVDEYRRVVAASLPKAEAAARRAIELDSNGADGYLALGYVQAVRGKWLAAEELYSKALALDSNNPDALHLYSLLLTEVGRVKEALPLRQRLQTQEPFVPVYNSITGLVLWLNGLNDNAIAMFKNLPAGGRGEPALAMIYAPAGRYGDAADILLTTPAGPFNSGIIEEAARLLRTAPAKAVRPQNLPRLGLLSWVFLYVGAPERALEYYEANAEAGFLLGGISSPLWHTSYAPVRKTEAFKAYALRAGLVDYWKARSWPDLCHPLGGDDFTCD